MAIDSQERHIPLAEGVNQDPFPPDHYPGMNQDEGIDYSAPEPYPEKFNPNALTAWLADVLVRGRAFDRTVAEDEPEPGRVTLPHLSRALVLRNDDTQNTRAEVYDPDHHDIVGAPTIPLTEALIAIDRAFETLSLHTYLHRKRARPHTEMRVIELTERELERLALRQLVGTGLVNPAYVQELQKRIAELEKHIRTEPKPGRKATPQQLKEWEERDGIPWDDPTP